jgi:2-aminoethylphosphonate-pyruvate transaminase
MTSAPNIPLLLTPGPLTTSEQTKTAMLRDWGSRDDAFIGINKTIRSVLVDVVNADQSHVCVPLQGSGTFAVEATLGTLIKPQDKALILINGAYGRRIKKILGIMGLNSVVWNTDETLPIDTDMVAEALNADSSISHVIAVHCETTSGILNPIEDIGRTTVEHGRKLIIDAMSSFGALPIDAEHISFDAIIASSNKCLEGVPGIGFAIIRKTSLIASEGNSPSLSLDLFDQWQAMEGNGQWRFTPPTHVIAAFQSTLEQFIAEGGQRGRLKRYSNNCRTLIDGMKALGFETLLPDHLQAPIIVTFKVPSDPNFNFDRFYASLKDKGFAIYPGKLTDAATFRMGCIGQLFPEHMNGAVAAVAETLNEQNISNCAPVAA